MRDSIRKRTEMNFEHILDLRTGLAVEDSSASLSAAPEPGGRREAVIYAINELERRRPCLQRVAPETDPSLPCDKQHSRSVKRTAELPARANPI